MPSQDPRVLIYGDPVDGFHFVGPITPNDPALDEYVDRELRDQTWLYAPLKPLRDARADSRYVNSDLHAEPHVRRFLDLCTSHLPEAIMRDLNGFVGVIAYNFEEGCLLWVPGDGDDVASMDEHADIPEEVVVIQRHARSLGCDYVLFDRDGPIDPSLPTWEW